MPMMPRPGCSYPGCRRKAIDGHGRCFEHLHVRRKPAEPDRKSAAARGYGAKWGKIRQRFLALNPYCYDHECLEPATQVDHIVSIARCVEMGIDPNDEGNLRAYCARHHSIKTNRVDGGLGNKKLVRGAR